MKKLLKNPSKPLLVAVDTLLAVAAYWLAFQLRFEWGLGTCTSAPDLYLYFVAFLITVGLLIGTSSLFGLFSKRKDATLATEILLLFLAVSATGMLLGVAAFFYRGHAFARLMLVYFCSIHFILASLWRLLLKKIRSKKEENLADEEKHIKDNPNSILPKHTYFLKTVVDIAGAGIGTVFVSPLFVVIALLVKIESAGPVFHFRRVVGRSGKLFYFIKFRSMTEDADDLLRNNPKLRVRFEDNYKLENDFRITRIGAVLRKTSLDELPQLLNVIKGDMSLVGPRPVTPDELSKHTRWCRRLLSVKPGMTGMWQACGRNDICYKERIKLNMYYVKYVSLVLDLKLLLKTMFVVVRGKGAR